MGQALKASALQTAGVKDEASAKEEVIAKVSSTVTGITGVQLGDRQRPMLESRLQRRISELGLSGYLNYLTYLEDHFESEREGLIALLTTHHTYFFREFSQFEILEQKLPELLARVSARGDKKLRIWSAACSRGQEVYSLAMFLDQVLKRVAPGIDYEIFGSDVDAESVAIAQNGVYHRREIKDAPMLYLADHWAKGKGEIADFVKARQSLRSHCSFDTINLLELSNKLQGKRFDVIFCRNVFIYFTPDRVRSITMEFLKHLEAHGQLYIGISESLNGLDVPLKPLGPSVYARKEAATAAAPAKPAFAQPVSTPQTLRVLCVDDSSSILTLMKRILTREHGFEVVGTAENGLDAAKKVAELKPDLLTLDIHMPQQSGIEYLKAAMGPSHPPVVMVSSVSREDSSLALQALSLGASDYVEKPSLSNMADRGEEIRVKLKAAWRSKTVAKGALKLEKSFSRSQVITGCEKKLRVIFAGLSDRGRLAHLFKELSRPQPPTVLVLEGAGEVIHQLSSWLGADTGFKVEILKSGGAPLRADTISIVDFSQVAEFSNIWKGMPTSILIYGETSKHAGEVVRRWSDAHVLVEDLGGGKATQGLEKVAADVVPVTSFAYMSSEFLAGKKT